MIRVSLVGVFGLFFLISCQKGEADPVVNIDPYTVYTIETGQHYSSNNSYKPISGLNALNFVVRFDSSAIYRTIDPVNQADINKLYGFADNNKPHQVNSARIGWRWFNNNLELLGYVYNDSILSHRSIGNVALLKDLNCSIRIEDRFYVFTVDGSTISMPRTALGTTATGYQLYPYFGGTETAPHTIKIKIRDR